MRWKIQHYFENKEPYEFKSLEKTADEFFRLTEEFEKGEKNA